MTSSAKTQNEHLVTQSDDPFDLVDISEEMVAAEHIEASAVIPSDCAGLRFDQVAAALFSDYSRERLKHWMEQGQLLVNGHQAKGKARCAGGEMLTLQAQSEPENHFIAQNIPLDIIFEDDDLLVVNKPAGLVVHPGSGNPNGTLVNALIFHRPQLTQVPRAGLVHRIDKDTSGLLVVAKNLASMTHLTEQLSAKTISRVYHAVVVGTVIAGGVIDQPLARHTHDRTRFCVRPGGREAVTHYHVVEKYRHHTLLKIALETGRTHQIRVHFAHLHWPLVGDPVYGRLKFPKGADAVLTTQLQTFKRQALHASQLQLVHPKTGEELNFDAPWPADFAQLVAVLKEHDV